MSLTTVSVVVPLLNEEKALPKFLTDLQMLEGAEILLVDGGSTDGTWQLLGRWLGTLPYRAHRGKQLLRTDCGRGRQMNEGARKATGEILLFLHVDSTFPVKGLDALRQALERPDVVGGAFRLKIDATHPVLKFIERMANFRARFLKLPYGDQGLFVRRDLFERLGGYSTLPLMEDVDLIRRMKQMGKVVLLQEAIVTSPRRWIREGIYYTTFRNLALISLYFIGVSPRTLAKWYR
ncbi:MAG: TIGR04283 family arsenosugar biosynthesis glycosyltransferase [Nitrospirae bacterium]|nr:TIGR04283 family arsenosugar biosynthesis glycosyltransferase [Candidatus Manganitrophaceae bacterium]